MTRLFLATESFPYGKGEKMFILPELKRLQKYYDIVVLTHADADQIAENMCEGMPENIKVVCLGKPVLSCADKIRALVAYLMDSDGRTEIREILSGKKAIGERLYQSLSFYAQAISDQRELRKRGIFTTDEQMIYYSFWYTYFCYSAVRESRRCPNIRILTRTHGCDLYHERVPGDRQPFRHQMEPALDGIFFGCHYGKKYYAERVARNIDPERLHVCRVGTESTPKSAEPGIREAWHLVSCSNVIPLKRIPLIIDGLVLVKSHKIHWTHIGDGSDLSRVKDYAKTKLGTSDNVSYDFRGFMENAKVKQYYTDHPADCFITTSSTEGGSPVSIQEAMEHGIPIIGTDVGGITEMIRGNGILLPSDPDGEAVASAICRMISFDKDTIEDMQNTSHAIWEQEFDINVTFQSLMGVLNGK